ncbi:MAG: hypothetical protein IJI10_07625 [Eubacterium sp.]|nr:hypothetical protein [Eubacterium sp.]
MGCMYCEKNNSTRDKALMRITELKSSVLYLCRNQAHPGHCVLALKEHIPSLQECTEQQKADVSADLGMMTGLIRKIAGSSCLAVTAAVNRDTADHLHYHILPQYAGEDDPLSGEDPDPVFPKEEECAEMAEMFRVLIQQEIQKTAGQESKSAE